MQVSGKSSNKTKTSGYDDRNSQNSIDVTDHRNWFFRLQSRYSWDKAQWGPINIAIDGLEKRAQDSRLFLGIVGEFSSGKSTLINAFLRENLLKTNILPATTCATTILEYGPQVDVLLEFYDSKPVRHNGTPANSATYTGANRTSVDDPNALDEVRHFIHRYTATEEHARTVQQVHVTHPNEKLKTGLVIVDTPGINVENPRHAAVTQNAVRNICDAVVVIVPAPAACSQTLVHFIKGHLSDAIHRCLVVVTKIDLIQPAERDQLMRYISARLEKECGATFAAVLSAAPCFVLDGSAPSINSASDSLESFRDSFFHTEEYVFALLERSRPVVIAEHIINIILRILAMLEEAIQTRRAEYIGCHDALESNRIQDLGDFIGAQKTSYSASINKVAQGIRMKIADITSEMRDSLSTKTEKAIQSAVNQNGLQFVLSTLLDTQFKRAYEAYAEKWDCLRQQLLEHENEFQAEFESAFTEAYRSLETLGGRVVAHGDGAKFTNKSQAGMLDAANKSAQPIAKAIKNSETADARWITTGAVIGSFVVPLIGTAIGGGVAWLGRKLFGTPLPTLKQQALANTRQNVNAFANECRKNLEEIVNNHIQQTLINFNRAADRYATAYDAKVQELVQADKAAKQHLEQYVSLAENDLAELKSREKRAKQTLERLRLPLQAEMEGRV